MSQLVQTHEGMVEHLEKVSNALSNRKDGTMTESSNAPIHASNVAEHPMGPKIKGIWENMAGIGVVDVGVGNKNMRHAIVEKSGKPSTVTKHQIPTGMQCLVYQTVVAP